MAHAVSHKLHTKYYNFSKKSSKREGTEYDVATPSEFACIEMQRE